MSAPRLPSASLGEHLQKMSTIAAGAMRALDRRDRREDVRQKGWWEGYRQAVEEVVYFTKREAELRSGDGDGGGGA